MAPRGDDAIAWASRTTFPSPPSMGEVEAEVIARTRPGLRGIVPAASLEVASLGPDERAVLMARTRVLTILGDRGAISADVRMRAASLPLGAWGSLDDE